MSVNAHISSHIDNREEIALQSLLVPGVIFCPRADTVDFCGYSAWEAQGKHFFNSLVSTNSSQWWSLNDSHWSFTFIKCETEDLRSNFKGYYKMALLPVKLLLSNKHRDASKFWKDRMIVTQRAVTNPGLEQSHR